MGVWRMSGLALSCAAFFALTSYARSDSVNGHWCGPEKRRLFIQGDDVFINNSSRTVGDYGKHHYVFEMPENEFMGGSRVDMVLSSPTIAHVRYISKMGRELNENPEVWSRCAAGSS